MRPRHSDFRSPIVPVRPTHTDHTLSTLHTYHALNTQTLTHTHCVGGQHTVTTTEGGYDVVCETPLAG